MTLSYTQGSTLTPLLEKTIGEAFEDTVQRYGSCLALVDRHQRLRFTWAETYRKNKRPFHPSPTALDRS